MGSLFPLFHGTVTNCQKRLAMAIYSKSHSIIWLLFQAHNSLFKFGRQRSTMNIMSTLGEEVDKGGDGFNEEEEDTEESSSVITTSSGENKVIVRMRDKKCLSRPQSDETSRVRQQLISALSILHVISLSFTSHQKCENS